MRVIMMGPPGVGKGTASKQLVKQYRIPHISTGDIFRELFSGDSEIGKVAKSYIDRGALVPDEITNEIVRLRLEKEDVQHGFLFDGYPRNINQAKALDKVLKSKGWKLDAVCDLQADDQVLIDRISGRRVCETCGAVYHIENNKTIHVVPINNNIEQFGMKPNTVNIVNSIPLKSPNSLANCKEIMASMNTSYDVVGVMIKNNLGQRWKFRNPNYA